MGMREGKRRLVTFSAETEFRHMRIRLERFIEIRSRMALTRISDMYTVGVGICYCGSDMDAHNPYYDNHSPVEMRRDKDYYDG
jgi:hypothetical protein